MITLAKKNILITGGAGFIGSHLVDRAIKEKPGKLVVIDNLSLGKKENLKQAKKAFPGLKFKQIDASNYPAMKKILISENIDVVFNLAVIPLPASLKHPLSSIEINIAIVTTLCELLRMKYYQTLIHFSSSEAYGNCQYSPMDENHPLLPTTPYAASKAAGDHIVLSYRKTFGIDTAIIKPFNNYGPRQNEGNYAGIIPKVINRILHNQYIEIYGDGEQTRDFIFVTDTADATIEIYKNHITRGQIINIGNCKEISINKVIETITGLLDHKVRIYKRRERPGDVRRLHASIKLAHRLIGFDPKTSFEEGIKQTILWYQQQYRLNGKKLDNK